MTGTANSIHNVSPDSALFFMFWSFPFVFFCFGFFRGVRCCHHKLVPSDDGNCRDHDEMLCDIWVLSRIVRRFSHRDTRHYYDSLPV